MLALKPAGATRTAVRRHRTVKARVVLTYTPVTGKPRKTAVAVTFALPARAAAAKKAGS